MGIQAARFGPKNAVPGARRRPRIEPNSLTWFGLGLPPQWAERATHAPSMPLPGSNPFPNRLRGNGSDPDSARGERIWSLWLAKGAVLHPSDSVDQVERGCGASRCYDNLLIAVPWNLHQHVVSKELLHRFLGNDPQVPTSTLLVIHWGRIRCFPYGQPHAVKHSDEIRPTRVGLSDARNSEFL